MKVNIYSKTNLQKLIFPFTESVIESVKRRIWLCAGILRRYQGKRANLKKRAFQEKKSRQIFRKTNISYPLIRVIRFTENLVCFVFLKHPFLDSLFCLITDVLMLFLWEIFSDLSSGKLSYFLRIFLETLSLQKTQLPLKGPLLKWLQFFLYYHKIVLLSISFSNKETAFYKTSLGGLILPWLLCD